MRDLTPEFSVELAQTAAVRVDLSISVNGLYVTARLTAEEAEALRDEIDAVLEEVNE